MEKFVSFLEKKTQVQLISSEISHFELIIIAQFLLFYDSYRKTDYSIVKDIKTWLIFTFPSITFHFIEEKQILKFLQYLFRYGSEKKSVHIIVRDVKIEPMTPIWVFLQLRSKRYSNPSKIPQSQLLQRYFSIEFLYCLHLLSEK